MQSDLSAAATALVIDHAASRRQAAGFSSRRSAWLLAAYAALVIACIVSLITGCTLVTGQTLTVDSGMMISGFQVKFS